MKKYMSSTKHELDTDKCTFVLTACICLNLKKASRAITQMYDEALRPSGLRSTQLPVVVALVSTGPTTVNNLADDLVMDRTSLSRLLQILVGRGLVKMEPGEDRRTRELSITSNGLAKAAGKT